MGKSKVCIHWFRRDLRLHDNTALFHALHSGYEVVPVFIFDTTILSLLEDKKDRRVEFIHHTLAAMHKTLCEMGSSLVVYYGDPVEVWKEISALYQPAAVFTNHDYEPHAIQRDAAVESFLTSQGIAFHSYKDQCIFEKNEIVKDDGSPYTVFTPYSKKWRSKITPEHLRSVDCTSVFSSFQKTPPKPFPSLQQIGFEPTGAVFPPVQSRMGIIRHYAEQRDFPALDATSHLSVHFRFGTISVREKLQMAWDISTVWVNELIWREFYMQILWHFPHVVTSSFKPAYDSIAWNNKEADFEAWCTGNTGYPIVDAGMRQLNETGFMHNRLRMITASFLTKHLLIDWRWGEAYFAQKLLDFDLSANNGGWQWASGSGTDAAPYFRIFNPYLQTQKFDKDLIFIREWVKEYGTDAYVKPVVDHEYARKRCLHAYSIALKKP